MNTLVIVTLCLLEISALESSRLRAVLQATLRTEAETRTSQFPYHAESSHGESFAQGVIVAAKKINPASDPAVVTSIANLFGKKHDAAYYDTVSNNGFTPQPVFVASGAGAGNLASVAEEGRYCLDSTKEDFKSDNSNAHDFGFGHEVPSACQALGALKAEELSETATVVAGLVMLAGTLHEAPTGGTSAENKLDRIKNLYDGLAGTDGSLYAVYGPCPKFNSPEGNTIKDNLQAIAEGTVPLTTVGAAGLQYSEWFSVGDYADFHGYTKQDASSFCLSLNMFGETIYGGAYQALKKPGRDFKKSPPGPGPLYKKYKLSDNFMGYWTGQNGFFSYLAATGDFFETKRSEYNHAFALLGDEAGAAIVKYVGDRVQAIKDDVTCASGVISECKAITDQCKFQGGRWAAKLEAMRGIDVLTERYFSHKVPVLNKAIKAYNALLKGKSEADLPDLKLEAKLSSELDVVKNKVHNMKVHKESWKPVTIAEVDKLQKRLDALEEMTVPSLDA